MSYFFGALAFCCGVVAFVLLFVSAVIVVAHGAAPWEASAICAWCAIGALVLGGLFLAAALNIEDAA